MSLPSVDLLNHGQAEKTEVAIDWSRFEPGQEIGKISCEGSSRMIRDATPGTTLVMEGNREGRSPKKLAAANQDLIKANAARKSRAEARSLSSSMFHEP